MILDAEGSNIGSVRKPMNAGKKNAGEAIQGELFRSRDFK